MSLGSYFKSIYARDPAAVDPLEIIFAYPYLHALFFHRIAHRLYRGGIPVLPRLIIVL